MCEVGCFSPCFFRLSMNTGDVSGAVTLDAVNSVTFTQDTDGNIILHCAQTGEKHLFSADLSLYEFTGARLLVDQW